MSGYRVFDDYHVVDRIIRVTIVFTRISAKPISLLYKVDVFIVVVRLLASWKIK